MWSCSFCSYDNASHLVHCKACGRRYLIGQPVLVGDAGRMELDSLSQIIGREQIKCIVKRSSETIRPRHVRFYIDSSGGRPKWLMSNLSKSSPVKHNGKNLVPMHFTTIQDGDRIECGAAEFEVSLKEDTLTNHVTID